MKESPFDDSTLDNIEINTEKNEINAIKPIL